MPPLKIASNYRWINSASVVQAFHKVDKASCGGTRLVSLDGVRGVKMDVVEVESILLVVRERKPNSARLEMRLCMIVRPH